MFPDVPVEKWLERAKSSPRHIFLLINTLLYWTCVMLTGFLYTGSLLHVLTL